MLNDRQASELVSKSLRQKLSPAESKAVSEHLKENDASAAFAKISTVIQDSVADIGVLSTAGDPSVSTPMPSDVRERLNKSVRAALLKQAGTDDVKATDGSDTSHAPQTKLTPAGAQLGKTLGKTFDQPMAADSQRLNDTGHEIAEIIEMPQDSSEARLLVSRYTLLRELGAGGLGRVWLARDEKLKRHVAIKEINVDAAESPRAWQRFHREAEITGHLEHPNVVPLYQFGTDPKRGQPFYAMRFVGKRTLADAIVEYHEQHSQQRSGEASDLELHRLLITFLDVCQAIAYAHSRGVVHRDLKPENVALDTFGQVIVLDWGLAKLTHEGELTTRLAGSIGHDETSLTETMDGEVVGTPLYMSPEQAAGDLGNIDERTDVYGLGAVLFAILTGYAPHEKSHLDTEDRLDVRRVLAAIAKAETPDPRTYNKSIANQLAAICVKAMARKPYARHSGASQLADDVERWMAGQNRKRQQLENLRIEGRELCANSKSALRDLATSTRFMAVLPPIQGTIDAMLHSSDSPCENEDIWRDRLTTIYRGLLQSNSDYLAVTYSRVAEGQCHELARIERSGADSGNIRSVPRSRLRHVPVDDWSERVTQQKPEDVLYGFADNDEAKCSALIVVAAVPVFDQTTEEPFGYVSIEVDLGRVLEREMRTRIRAASEVIVLDEDNRVLIHESRSQGRVPRSFKQPLETVLPESEVLIEYLRDASEFLDELNRETYATTLDVERQRMKLTFVLTQRERNEYLQ